MAYGEGQERRQAVRVSDRILFSCSRVEPEKYEALASDFAKGIPPYHQEEMREIRLFIGAQNALARLRNRDADLADFLQHLDNKINLVLREARQGQSPLDRLTPRTISLSSGGMAFVAAEGHQPGEHLELHLVLLPSDVYIYCLGSVVSCQKSGEGPLPYRISLRFSLLTEDDHEKIIQHIFKLQSQALRKRRQQY